MGDSTVIATALAVSALLFSGSPATSTQIWGDAHPARIDAIGHVLSPGVKAETKPAPFREAQFRAGDDARPDEMTRIGKGPLDHPANANGESSRHE